MTFYLYDWTDSLTDTTYPIIIKILPDNSIETWTHDPENPREELAEWLEAGNTLEPWDHDLNPARHSE